MRVRIPSYHIFLWTVCFMQSPPPLWPQPWPKQGGGGLTALQADSDKFWLIKGGGLSALQVTQKTIQILKNIIVSACCGHVLWWFGLFFFFIYTAGFYYCDVVEVFSHLSWKCTMVILYQHFLCLLRICNIEILALFFVPAVGLYYVNFSSIFFRACCAIKKK